MVVGAARSERTKKRDGSPPKTRIFVSKIYIGGVMLVEKEPYSS